MDTSAGLSHESVANVYAEKPWLRSTPEGVPQEIDPVGFASIPELVSWTCERYGDRPAFSNMGHSLTFTEIDELSTRLAAYLRTVLGLAPGERIILQMPNLLQYPVAIFGALKAGLVVVNANPLYTTHEMEVTFRDSGAAAIIALENFADKIEAVLPSTSIKHVIITEVGDLLPTPRRVVTNFAVRYVKRLIPPHELGSVIRFRDALAEGARAQFQPPQIGQDDLAFLQYTGGTTGVTKAAELTHLNLLSNQYQMMGPMSVSLDPGHETVLAALPLYHVFCLTVNCLGLFHYGSHNVLITNPRETDALISTMARYRPSVLILVSTLAGALVEKPKYAHLDFSQLKLAVAGGMAVRTSVAERWKDVTGVELVEGYGLTEASPVVSVNPTVGSPRRGTIGLPLPSTEVELRDESGALAPLGEPGELLVRGPQVMRGYWKQPEETERVLEADGWLHTGDIATMDADGFLTIVDRKKDMIVVSGFNVYPNEVEDAALLNPKVAEAGAIGIPSEHSGEVVKLFVVRRDPSLTEEELRAFLTDYLAGYKRPKAIEFRDELPKSPVGKVLRRELRTGEDSAAATS
ncbi:AMP-binding protein [Compostimonas suwonensis]|uniref:Long-chain-fatty-acid--CoA ligase n=1 Tax=Compostimonas suwonensis TaxID=1048394 RepID=A0A2M9BYS2_9MICO|nr:AMP-binding protein [Compostimonas suwonensis]PJJ63225.1 long-chain acyl-CoA synthetase [Compostimonas suwonensis]